MTSDEKTSEIPLEALLDLLPRNEGANLRAALAEHRRALVDARRELEEVRRQREEILIRVEQLEEARDANRVQVSRLIEIAELNVKATDRIEKEHEQFKAIVDGIRWSHTTSSAAVAEIRRLTPNDAETLQAIADRLSTAEEQLKDVRETIAIEKDRG